MSWEQWFCPTRSCADRGWMVQRHPTTQEVWRVAEEVDDSPFTVAAPEPVYPRCGTTLHRPLELDERDALHRGAEVGPAFEFVKGLSQSTKGG